MTTKVIETLAFLTLLSNAGLVLLVLIYLLQNHSKQIKNYWIQFQKYIIKNYKYLILLFSLVATAGSLFLSEVALYTPCKFCWIQRIFMYPIVFLALAALTKKAKDLPTYSLFLSIPGALMAGWHYYNQVRPEAFAPCSTVGFSVSCSERFFTYYNYITIPWMALSAFLLITFVALVKLKVVK